MALVRQAWRLLLLTVVFGAALFGAAGTLRRRAAWAFLGLHGRDHLLRRRLQPLLLRGRADPEGPSCT